MVLIDLMIGWSRKSSFGHSARHIYIYIFLPWHLFNIRQVWLLPRKWWAHLIGWHQKWFMRLVIACEYQNLTFFFVFWLNLTALHYSWPNYCWHTNVGLSGSPGFCIYWINSHNCIYKINKPQFWLCKALSMSKNLVSSLLLFWLS